ncbi:MAG: hypothetical protein HFH43_04275 [Lachnospiraceae bacterium]|nr:hypothetical protein [Lachnospiraceae bacterium]
MPFKVKVAENLSRDKGRSSCHGSFEDIISQGGSIDLRGNIEVIDLQNGYIKIVPVDETRRFKNN